MFQGYHTDCPTAMPIRHPLNDLLYYIVCASSSFCDPRARVHGGDLGSKTSIPKTRRDHRSLSETLCRFLRMNYAAWGWKFAAANWKYKLEKRPSALGRSYDPILRFTRDRFRLRCRREINLARTVIPRRDFRFGMPLSQRTRLSSLDNV